jgi:hypothetical protein
MASATGYHGMRSALPRRGISQSRAERGEVLRALRKADKIVLSVGKEASETAHSLDSWQKSGGAVKTQHVELEVQVLKRTHLGEGRRKSGSATAAQHIAPEIQIDQRSHLPQCRSQSGRAHFSDGIQMKDKPPQVDEPRKHARQSGGTSISQSSSSEIQVRHGLRELLIALNVLLAPLTGVTELYESRHMNHSAFSRTSFPYKIKKFNFFVKLR